MPTKAKYFNEEWKTYLSINKSLVREIELIHNSLVNTHENGMRMNIFKLTQILFRISQYI
jgi:hypothetical protein